MNLYLRLKFDLQRSSVAWKSLNILPNNILIQVNDQNRHLFLLFSTITLLTIQHIFEQCKKHRAPNKNFAESWKSSIVTEVIIAARHIAVFCLAYELASHCVAIITFKTTPLVNIKL